MGTFFVGFLVLAVITGAARQVYKDAKNNSSCSCSGCGKCNKYS